VGGLLWYSGAPSFGSGLEDFGGRPMEYWHGPQMPADPGGDPLEMGIGSVFILFWNSVIRNSIFFKQLQSKVR
jgi:hypothetical protein